MDRGAWLQSTGSQNQTRLSTAQASSRKKQAFCSLKILGAGNPVDAGGDLEEVMPCEEESVHGMRTLKKVYL